MSPKKSSAKKPPLKIIPKKPEANYDVDSLLKYIEQLRAAEEHQLYMPEGNHVWEEAEAGEYKLPEYWEDYKQGLRNLKPKNKRDLFRLGTSVGNPTGYALWKMPPRMHYHFNRFLDYASRFLGEKGAEEPATGLRIASGLSKLIYASKTKQGKHFAHGLTETLDGMEATNDPRVVEFAQQTREIFREQLSQESKKKKAT